MNGGRINERKPQNIMKTETIEIYSFNELADDAKRKALQTIAEEIQRDPDNFTLDEGMASLHAIAEAMNTKLANWNVGPYNHNSHASISVPWHCEKVWEGGNKTLASFLRMLIRHGYERPKHFKDMKFPGTCGFTGVGFDDDLVEAIWEALLEGDSLNDAFDRAADRLMTICEEDLRYRTSEEGIMEALDCDEEVWNKGGTRYRY